jgi:hypothetical protein
MQYFHLHEYRYLIFLKKRYTWEFFRKQVKVTPGTYSEDFARSLYNSVFESSNDLNLEYGKYYKNEYENIHQFIFWRYGVSEGICEQIPNADDGYLAVFDAGWQMEDDDLLRETFIAIFRELDK